MADYTWEKICENITVPTFNSEKEEVFIVYGNKIHLFDDEKHYYLDEDSSSFVEHELPTKGGKYKLVQHYDSDTHQYVTDSETGANYFNFKDDIIAITPETPDKFFYISAGSWGNYSNNWSDTNNYNNGVIGSNSQHKFVYFNNYLYDFTSYVKYSASGAYDIRYSNGEGIKPLEEITGDYYAGDTVLDGNSFSQYTIYDNYIIGTGDYSSDIDGWMTGYGFYDAENDEFSFTEWDRDFLDHVILVIYKDQIFFLNNEGYNNRKANAENFLDAQYGADFTEIGADDLNFYYACVFNDSIYAIVKNENSYDIYRYHEPTQYSIMSYSDTKNSFKNIKKYIHKNSFLLKKISASNISASENNTKLTFSLDTNEIDDSFDTVWNGPEGDVEVTVSACDSHYDNGSFINFKIPGKVFISISEDMIPSSLDSYVYQNGLKIKITHRTGDYPATHVSSTIEVTGIPTGFYESSYVWNVSARYIQTSYGSQ